MIYRVGEYTLDIDRQEIQRGPDPIPVQKKVFDLLLFLMEHRHRALSKEEIQDAIWPDTIVSETALTRAILKARRALGDDAQTQGVIKTLHGTGYRFIAEIEEVPESEARVDAPATTEDRRSGSGNVSGGRRVEDRRSDLFRVATVYGAIAWLTNQIAAMVFEAFELEKLGLQIILGISVIGFPLALAITWFFSWTPSGLKRRDEVLNLPLARTRNPYFLSAIILLLAFGITLTWQLREPDLVTDTALPLNSDARVAVLPVVNQSGAEDDHWTRLGIMSLLAEELRQARVNVLSSSTVLRMVGEDISQLPVDKNLMHRFASSQNIEFLVVPTLNRTAQGYTMSLALFNGTKSWSMTESGDVLPTELAMTLSQQLIAHLRPERYASQFQRAISQDAFVNELYARGMYEELSGNLREALDLFALAVKQDPEFFLARYEYAITTRYLGNFEEAEPLLEDLLLEAERLANAHYIAIVCNALGVLFDLQGRMDEAETTYKMGIEAAQSAELGSQHATLLVNYAILQRSRGELPQARQLIGQALNLYRTNRIPANGAVYITLANISVYESNLREAEANYQQALETFEMQEQPSGAAIALSNLAWLAQEEHRYEDSLQFLNRSLAIRREIDDRVGILRSLIRQASLQFDMGLFDDSKAAAEAVLADSHSEQEQDLKATAIALVGMIAAEHGDFDLGVQNLETAIDVRIERQDVSGRLTAQNVLTNILIKAGRFREANDLLDQVVSDATEHKQPSAEIEALLNKAELAHFTQDIDSSLAALQSALDKVRLVANEPLEQKVTIALAEARLELGEVTAAEGLLGFFSDAPANRNLALARTRLHELKGEYNEAVAALEVAKNLSHQRWRDEDEARLQSLLVKAI